MKKYIAFLLLILLMPTIALAKVESNTLSEAIKDEGIENDLGDYDDNEEKPVIYLFRGKGCSHCYEFLEYASTDLVKNYGDKFRLQTYEVWNNKDNANLMQSVSDYFNDNASGVPYIVIGEKTFNGYSKSMNKDIESAIDKLNESEKKFDVLKKVDLKKIKSDKSETDSTSIIVFTLFALVALVVLVVTSFKKKEA